MPITTPEAIVKKLAKKTKMGEYDPAEVVQALNLIDPGWKIDDAVEAMPLRGREAVSLDKDLVEKVGFSGAPPHVSVYDTTIYVSWRYGAEDRSGGTRPTEKVVKDVTDEVLKQIKLQVDIAKTPSNPKIDQTYIDKLPKPKMEWDVKAQWGDAQSTSMEFKLTGVKRGVRVVNITSPKGLKISLQGENSPSLWTALYRTDIDQKAKAYLDTPDVVKKTEREQMLKSIGDKVGKVGTCAICENQQMLNRNRLDKEGNPTMVLHGYLRPGVGYVIGDCYGVGWAPYELSAAACEGWRDELVEMIANQKRNVAGAKALKKLEGIYFAVKENKWDYPTEFQKGTIHSDGTVESSGDKVKRATLPKNTGTVNFLPGEEVATFEKVKNSIIRDAEGRLAAMEHDHKRMVQKIKDWSLQPLPGTSAEDAQFSEQMKAKLCPGSGTTNHDNSHTGRYMSQWATCNVCGQKGVSVNKSSNKMRAHAPAKVKAMTASRRIDEVAEKLLTFTTPEKVRAAVEEAADLLAKIE